MTLDLNLDYIETEYLNGKSLHKLSEELGCDRKTIKKYLLECGVNLRDYKDAYDLGLEYKKMVGPKKKLNMDYIKSHYSAGETIHKIAKDLNVGSTTIFRRIEEMGITRKQDGGMENHPQWKGGISFEPYCEKFNKPFKERVREFWGRKCGICGKNEVDNGQRLQVHHVNYAKMVCCDDTPPLFIPLCKSCHPRTNHNRLGWEYNLTEYIMIWFNGECF